MAIFFVALALMAASTPDAHAAEGPVSVAIEIVKPGREGLEFSAHLAGAGGTITRGISWTISTADGEDIYSGNAPSADVVTPPGDYVVNVQFGSGRLTRLVSLPEGCRLRIDFALNAGGLRIVPRAGGAPLPSGGARIRVFTLQDGQPNRRMAINATAGEILPLPEGRYRVESQVGDGNAKAVADVAVRAGRLSTVEIGHKAGIARLSLSGASPAKTEWTVEDANGRPVASRDGAEASVILAPGNYTATAKTGVGTLTKTFSVAAGRSRDVILGD